MKKLNNIVLLSISLILLFSCDDILEDDITNDSVVVTAPLNGAVIEGNTVQFTWESLESVDSYRIQVIDNTQIRVVDSLVTNTVFNYNLDQGNYQWRIRGENFAYSSAYNFPNNFSVEQSNDLEGQVVNLQTPSGNFYSNIPVTIFNWEKITAADSYDFQIIKKLNGEQGVVQEPGITENSINVDGTLLNEDAEYIWKVKAINSSSETEFSQRSFFIDTQAPNQPTLSVPNDEHTIGASTVTFNWINGADTGNVKSSIENTLEISTDSNFGTILQSIETENNSAQYEFTNLNTYYWRVKAKDIAGNESDYSIVRSIIVE